MKRKLLIEKIIELKESHILLKHEQLVQGIIQSIDEGIVERGDQLPSINRMVNDIGYARKTIVKSYEELKDRGLVESIKLKGYFIASEETKVTLRVALLLFSLQRFQEDFYSTFRDCLGEKYHIDVFFHHNNIDVFETIFYNIKGKYGKYVVAPIPDPYIANLLQKIEPSKLLIVDRFIKMPKEYSYISQEFENSTYANLVELLPEIRKYKKMILILPKNSYYAQGIIDAFNKFIYDHKIKGSVKDKYENRSIKKGSLYFFLSETFLWELLRDSLEMGYKVGSDVGILSHDDYLAKQIVFGGITTISTDFYELAIKAATNVKEGGLIQEIIPINLIKRNSV